MIRACYQIMPSVSLSRQPDKVLDKKTGSLKRETACFFKYPVSKLFH